MAVTIDATVGGANANSYVTEADAQELVDAMIKMQMSCIGVTGMTTRADVRWPMPHND